MTLDPLSSFRLDGRVAIVTGASSGLGARFARVLSAAGASVVITARREKRLRELAGDLGDAHVHVCDLSIEGAASGLVDAAVERYGHVDVLVNNAGSSEPVPALDQTTDHFTATLQVNLIAPFELARDTARVMIESGRGGAIVNIASIWGLVGVGQIPEAGYAAWHGGRGYMSRGAGAE